jgi:hypothetical protein
VETGLVVVQQVEHALSFWHAQCHQVGVNDASAPLSFNDGHQPLTLSRKASRGTLKAGRGPKWLHHHTRTRVMMNQIPLWTRTQLTHSLTHSACKEVQVQVIQPRDTAVSLVHCLLECARGSGAAGHQRQCTHRRCMIQNQFWNTARTPALTHSPHSPHSPHSRQHHRTRNRKLAVGQDECMVARQLSGKHRAYRLSRPHSHRVRALSVWCGGGECKHVVHN